MSKLYILCIIKCIHCSFVFNWRCKSIVLILSLLPLLSSFFVSPSSLSPHPFHFSDAVSLRSLTSPLPDAVPGRLPSCLYFTSFLLFLPFLLLLLRFYKYPALGESPHRRISCLSLFFPSPHFCLCFGQAHYQTSHVPCSLFGSWISVTRPSCESRVEKSAAAVMPKHSQRSVWLMTTPPPKQKLQGVCPLCQTNHLSRNMTAAGKGCKCLL